MVQFLAKPSAVGERPRDVRDACAVVLFEVRRERRVTFRRCRAEERDLLARDGVIRRDADRVPGALLALCAARAVAAGRVIAPPDALYLRSPDVTPPAARKRVGT